MPLIHENVDSAECIARSAAMAELGAADYRGEGRKRLAKEMEYRAVALHQALYFVLLERRCKAAPDGRANAEDLYEEATRLIEEQKE